MSILGKNLILSNNTTELKPHKKVSKKLISITPKKINLCKKYFYIDKSKAINLKQMNDGKILQLMDNGNNKEKGDVLEQVDYVMTQFEQKKMELNKKKIDCIKSMILNNKKIPEKWIMKPNYKDLLNEVMEDEIVLNYAIVCQDKYKKNAGLDETDETRYLNFKKNLPLEKKFKSYINPYSRNYFDSPTKKRLMKEYCFSIRKNNKDSLRKKKLYNNSLNGNMIYKKMIFDKNKSVEGIVKDKIKLPLINPKSKFDNDENNKIKDENLINNIKSKDENLIKNNNMNETNEELMVTSLYYSGLDTKNKNNNDKLPELPMI